MSRNYIAELDDRVGCMGGKTVHYQSDSRNGCGWFRRRDENILVPILNGYKIPYDYAITDEIGTEHYIYYEELDI